MNTFIGFAYVVILIALAAVVGWFASANSSLTAPLTVLFGLMSFGLGMATLHISYEGKAAKEAALREKVEQEVQQRLSHAERRQSPYEDPSAYR